MAYRVIHAIAGRCRLHVPQLTGDRAFANRVIELIESLRFVTEVRINPEASSLIVTYQSSSITSAEAQEKFITCLQAAWLDNSDALAELEAEKIARTDWEAEAEDIGHQADEWERLGLPFLGLGLALLAAPLELPPLIVGTAIAGAALPWFTRAAQHAATERQLNVDFLDTLWITLQMVNGQYVAPSLKTSLVGSRAKVREEVGQTKENRALLLTDAALPEIKVSRNQQTKIIPIHQVQVGDQIWLAAGERIPVDGYILQGSAQIDEQPLRRATEPIWRNVGESVYASTQILTGQLCVSVCRTGVNTQSGLVAHLIESEPVYDTQIAADQAEFARHAVLPTLCFGGAIFAMTGNLGSAIAPLQLDFGSGIQLSVRTVILSALTHAAQNGIYIRSGRALEALTQIDTLVFDQAVFNPQAFDLPSSSNSMARLELARDVIDCFHQQGLDTYLMSSDSASIALPIAEQLGIAAAQTYAEALPHHKATLVSGLHSHGRTVALIGDSSQSAAAFPCADLSIAYAHQGEVLNNLADVVLLDPDLSKLVEAVGIAKQAMAAIYQNTALTTLPNLAVTTGGIFFGLHPVVNVITNNCTAFLAEFVNSSRPLFTSPTAAPAAPATASSPSLQASPSPDLVHQVV